MTNLRRLAAALGLLWLASCSREAPTLAPPSPDVSALTVLDPWITDAAYTTTVRIIDRAFPGIRHDAGARFDQVFERALASSGAVLIPRARDLPWELWPPLQHFIAQGGCAIFWDARPFAGGVRATAGGIHRGADASREGKDRPPEGPFPDLDLRTFPLTGLLERVDVSGGVRPAGKIHSTVLRLPVEGCGGEGERVRRIPVARVVSADRAGAGMGAFVEGRLLDDGQLSRLGWLGIQPGEVTEGDLVDVLRDMVARLQDSHWLIGAGPAKASARPGEPLEVSYAYRPAGQHATEPVRMEIDLLDGRGEVLRRVRMTPVAGGRQTAALGLVPSDRGVGWVMNIRMRIVDSRTADIREEVRRPVLILPEPVASAAMRPPTTMGALSFFAVAGRPIFPLIVAADDPRLAARVLHPTTYPVGEIPGRLDRWRQVGLNTVAVTLDRPEQLPQLRHLLAETADRGMYVLLHLPIFPRPATDWSAARRLVDQLAQLDTHNLLAIDVSSPMTSTGLTYEVARSWLDEVIVPADDAPLLDPRIAERCAADLADRHRVAVRRLLRLAGLTHMLFDSGLFMAVIRHPQAAGAASDFATVRINPEQFRDKPERVAFQLAWERGLSGHPVLVMGATPAPTDFASEAALAWQSAEGSRLMKLAMMAQVAGVYFPMAEDGGDPWIQPDGRWRPAAYNLRDVLQELRAWPPPPFSKKILCDFDEDAWSETGATFAEFCAAFLRGEWLEIRPTSRDGGALDPTPISVHALHVWNELGALWTDIEVNGKPVWRAPGEPLRVSPRDRLRLTMCSVGARSWIPQVEARDDEARIRIDVAPPAGAPTSLRINRLAVGECGYAEWAAADSGPYTLRVMSPKTGPWGEALRVIVGEGKPSRLEMESWTQ